MELARQSAAPESAASVRQIPALCQLYVWISVVVDISLDRHRQKTSCDLTAKKWSSVEINDGRDVPESMAVRFQEPRVVTIYAHSAHLGV